MSEMMKRIYNLIKILLKNVLPEFILNVLKSKRYINTLKNFNIEKEPDLKLSKNIVKNGDKVIDIGANIGIYSKYLSAFVGKTGKVFSFEPIPITFQFLKQNIKLLNLDNIKSYNYALSDKSNKKTMIIPSVTAGENYFRATITEDQSQINNSRSYEVKSVPLDEILDNNIHYSFIKIDVEGHEEEVLKGGERIIEISKPVLLIEIDGNLADLTTSAGRVMKFLCDFGYEVFVNIDNKLVKWKKGINSVNYFFVFKDQLNQFKNVNIFR